jgi:hypothetical protein
MKHLVLLASMLLTAACSHDIEIKNKNFPDGRSVGDVVSSVSRERNCLYRDSPCTVTVMGSYIEEYRAVPHGPHTSFAGWENCPNPEGDLCTVNISAQVMRIFWGMKAPVSLVANFVADQPSREVFKIDTCTGEPTLCGLWMQYDFFYPYQPGHANFDGESDGTASIGVDTPYSSSYYRFELQKRHTQALEFGYEHFYSTDKQWARWKFDGGRWEYIFYTGRETIIMRGG